MPEAYPFAALADDVGGAGLSWLRLPHPAARRLMSQCRKPDKRPAWCKDEESGA